MLRMTSARLKYTRALTIAGSDSGGGAGIQADLKTFSALGCFGMTVITAVTAQNTCGVDQVYSLPEDVVEAQIHSVLNDLGVDTIKIGMLHSSKMIGCVQRALLPYLREHPTLSVVLDPVMVAKGGTPLLQTEAVDALKQQLLPLATMVTPNVPEAEALLGRPVTSCVEMENAAWDLLQCGSRAVVIKGGHLPGKMAQDLLMYRTEAAEIKAQWYKAERIETPNVHGTGCTFSSAIASYLGKGVTLEESVNLAKNYLTRAIARGASYQIGKGHGPVHHFHEMWGDISVL